MGLPRSTYYDAPPVKAHDAEIVANITAICDEFEAYGYRRVGAELIFIEGWSSIPRRSAADAPSISHPSAVGDLWPRPIRPRPLLAPFVAMTLL